MNVNAIPSLSSEWCTPLEGFIHGWDFTRLAKEFPSPELFYSLYTEHEAPKTIRANDAYQCGSRYRLEYEFVEEHLSKNWKTFCQELSHPQGEYVTRLKQLLPEPFEVRFSWHLAYDGFFITPHRDAKRKLASHLMYFNTPEDWDIASGGELCKLGKKRVGSHEDFPLFEDFDECLTVPILNNQSVFLYRTEASWHGVKPVRCEQNRFRKTFNVIFERINHGS